MTINGIRNNEDDVFVFWIANGSDNITLENMIINSVSDPLYDTGWSTPVYCSTYEVPSPLVGLDSFTLSNCEVIGGSTYGVFMDGESGKELSNFNIINNDVHDFQKYGIYVWAHIVDCNVEGNEVYQTFEEARSSVYGIRAGSSSCSGTTTIHHNYIHDMNHSANAHPYGIFMTSNSHDNLVYNNIIHLVPGLTANTPYCIYMSSGDNTNNQIYYNTLYIGGVNTRQYVDSYCIKIYKDASDNILKDNILINERTGDVSGNDHCAIYLKTATSFAESDYNFLTVNSDNSFDNRYVARIGSNYYNTLGDLQGSPGYSPRDQNSLTGNPDLSFPDLHLNSTSLCIGAGTPITGIITDFDYDIRDETNPDIGADEFISIHAEFCADTTQGYAPLTVQFTDLSIPQGSIISWEWDFDYDGTIDSYEQDPEWIYDEAGIYTVSLTVIGEDFADTETKEDYITVFPGIF
ncbi:MAG: PKD domain-containing protein, partial [Candidatus Cloacimonetes bacterium]|nr:PKD domain-containing protein [Candidatus Cloacimonadota bacterium]